MQASETLHPSAVRFVANAIAAGKPVEAALLAAYAAQTGLPVPTATAPAAVVPFSPEGGHQKETKAGPARARSVGRLLVQGGPGRGFVKLQRSPITDALVADKNALHLLIVIGLRARWSNEPSLEGLTRGQAQIGDYAAIDMSPKEYRCAKQRLEKWGLVHFRPTPLGTIATLPDSRVFSLTDERDATNQGQPEGQPKGELFSEEDLQNRANPGANPEAPEGRTKGELGATKQKDRRTAGSESNTERGSAKPEQARPRNLLFDVLAEATGNRVSEMVGRPAAACGTALASIRKATPDVTPEEIRRRAANYRTHFDAALTPSALANQWAKCHAAKDGARRQLSPEFNKW